MRLLNIKGKLINKNVEKHRIKWDGKSLSKLQFSIKKFLKPYWNGHVVYEEFPCFGSRLKVDILNATTKIAIECQGQQHSEFHYFHNKEPFNYIKGVSNDIIKAEWLEKNGYKLVEINYDEVENLSEVFFKEKFGVIL